MNIHRVVAKEKCVIAKKGAWCPSLSLLVVLQQSLVGFEHSKPHVIHRSTSGVPRLQTRSIIHLGIKQREIVVYSPIPLISRILNDIEIDPQRNSSGHRFTALCPVLFAAFLPILIRMTLAVIPLRLAHRLQMGCIIAFMPLTDFIWVVLAVLTLIGENGILILFIPFMPIHLGALFAIRPIKMSRIFLTPGAKFF